MPPQEHHNSTQQDNAPAVAERGDGRLIEFDEFIDAKLRKTRSHVRSVDFATNLMLLAAGTLVYILLAATFDHWIVTGGLGFWSRTAFLVVYLLAAGTYLTMTLVPLLLRNINPLYAAETIERSQPSLKNGLVNFLFFRDRPERLNPAIYQAVEEQAARNLAGASSDAAVDRTTLIRVGYALAGILLVAAIYALVSPKNLFRTVGRIAVPWAEIDAPTRTTIGEIEPRDAQAFRGQQIEVSARIRDLPEDAPVRLVYTTADRQTVDRAIEMKPSEDGYKHVCLLPGGESTLQQDLQYRIEAGDAVTRPFRLNVVAAPTIFVESVETKYPAYTGLLAQRVERQGDIKAIEGSEITLEAVANELIRTAHVDFDCDGTLDQRMSTSGERAKVTFKLALKDDRRTPKHSSYQLIFTNERDQRNPQPVRHQIEVTRDISPEIAFVAPTQDPFDVPVNGTATLEVVANDPDFALALVKVSLMQGEKPLADKLLLSEPRRGQFVGKYRFEPKSLGLKPGDVVTYTALAEDNKSPNPNRAETAKKTLRVTAAGDRGQQDQVAQNDSAKNDQSQAGDPSKGERQQGQPDGNAPDKEQDAGEQGEQPENADQKSDGDQGDSQQSASKDAGNQASRQPADEQPDDKSQSQEQQQGQSQSQPGQEQREAGEQQQGESKSDSQAGDQGSAGKQSKSSSSSGDKGKQQQSSQGDSGSDSANQQESPVANDGSNDGDAIERILKHRDQQQPSGEKPGKSAPPSAGDSKEKKAGDESANQADQPPASPGDKQDTRQKAREARDGADQPPASPGDKDKRNRSQQSRSGEKSGEQQAGEADADKREQGDQSPGERQQGESADDAKRDQQNGKSADDKSGDDASKSGQPGEQQDAKQGQSPDASQKSDTSNQRGDMKSDAKAADKQAGDKQSGNEQQQPGEAQSDDQKPADEGQGREQSKQGQGAKTKSDPMGNKKGASPDAEQSDAKGGDGEQPKGESGAGQKSADKQGSPSPQKVSKARDKSQSPSSDDPESKEDSNQAQSPSQTENESDSQGQDDGDRSGGGKRGGGQKANKAGTGGAGQNTAADEGAGASEQKGDGETSNRAGEDKQADGKTGKSGNQRGEGSKSQEAASKDGEQSPSSADAENSANGETSPEGSRDGQSSSGAGTPTGGNTDSKSDDSEPAERPYRTAPEVADEANLEYAREASDLALSHLKDELAKDQPDANLLKDLGWSRDDLQKFVSRWEQMRGDSKAPGAKGETARRELDDTLKSLGLRPRATSLQENSARDDAVRGLRESRKSSPPPEYAEQVKAYKQGTARGGK